MVWIGFRIRGIDYRRFLKHQHYTGVSFTIALELIEVGHDVYGTQFRGGLALLDGGNQEPLFAFTSKLLRLSPRGWLLDRDLRAARLKRERSGRLISSRKC